MTRRLLIIGAGMATGYLLQELSGSDHGMTITVIGDEPEVCYNRVLLSGVLAGEAAEHDLQMLDATSVSASVKFLSGTRVESVNTHNRFVLTDRGESLPYDLLVFATGANVARPSVAKNDAGGITQLRTLADVRRLRDSVAGGDRAVVVGGGLLGLEAAHGLNALGYATTVLHRQPYLMNRQLDAEGGNLLRITMERSGIAFRLQTSVTALQTLTEKLSAITLDNGEELPCDRLVLATGIEPNAALARAAGIASERGVLVDKYLQTSEEHCFALGECSQLGQHSVGLVAPIKLQAQVLSQRLLGAPGPEFVIEDWPTQLKISGVEIFSAGALHAIGEELVLRDDSAGIYRRLVLCGDRLVSAVLVGDKREGTWYADLIRTTADISQYRSGLMFGKDVSEAMQLSAVAA